MTQQPSQLLSAFNEIGLLGHLSQKELQAVEQNLQDLNPASPILALEILKKAPNTVYYPPLGVWDPALKDPQAYSLIFEQLKAVSHGRLQLDYEQIAPHNWGFIHAINKTLAAAGREERYYWINYPDDGVNGPQRGWAVIFLSYSQFKEVMRRRLLRLSAPYSWSADRVNDTIDTLKQVGLLSHLAEADLTSARAAILGVDMEERSLAFILETLHAAYSVDAESIHDIEADYKKLITRTGELAGGAFTIGDVTIKPLLSLTRGDRTYSRPLEVMGDWIDWGYLALMNKALEDSNKDGRFYLLEAEDQVGHVVFLNSEQFRKIQEMNLLPIVEVQ